MNKNIATDVLRLTDNLREVLIDTLIDAIVDDEAGEGNHCYYKGVIDDTRRNAVIAEDSLIIDVIEFFDIKLHSCDSCNGRFVEDDMADLGGDHDTVNGLVAYPAICLTCR